ncbi:hypothetical protein Psuf_078990 [Phytohabitans suffuscus]|uniref:Uncharacterized protein n=1 Tax=Phytohabitans suffuscus TaxID=624315 RepID=A0A6F8YX00_9ACTN|nr:hypothetical protein Psuf_078990 [Phytohabitans suffuscus]
MKNWVMAALSLSSWMPFCTSGEKPDVLTRGEVGRLDEADSLMNCSCAGAEARYDSSSLAPSTLRDLALAK